MKLKKKMCQEASETAPQTEEDRDTSQSARATAEHVEGEGASQNWQLVEHRLGQLESKQTELEGRLPRLNLKP